LHSRNDTRFNCTIECISKNSRPIDLSHNEKKRKKYNGRCFLFAMKIRIGQSYEPNGVIKFHVPRRDDSFTHTKESSIEYRIHFPRLPKVKLRMKLRKVLKFFTAWFENSNSLSERKLQIKNLYTNSFGLLLWYKVKESVVDLRYVI